MDSSVASARAVPAQSAPSAWIWFLLLVLVAYGVLLGRHVGAYGGGSDQSGYLNHAHLLSAGHLHVTPREIPGLPPGTASPWWYSPLGFKPAPDGNGLVPTYPVGLPLLVAAMALATGWDAAPHVTMWLHGILGVLLTYWLARVLGLSRRGAFLAAAIVGLSPLYLFMSLQLMSDVPALVWVTATVLLAWRSAERPNAAFAAGGAFALAVLVRPTNIIAIVPVLIALGASPARWWRFVAGGVPGGVFFLLHAHAAYGQYLTTGYGESHDFGWNWIGPTWAHYAHWLPLLFTPVVLGLLALPFIRTQRGLARRRTTLLIAWSATYLAFYCTYAYTSETWWYLRFVLPATPALVIAGLFAGRALLARWLPNVAGCTVFGAGLALTLGLSGYQTHRLGALNSGRGERHYVAVNTWLQRHVPANAIIAVMQQSGSLLCYTDFTFFRWDMVDPQSFAKITAAAETAHRPIYAVLFDFEQKERHALDNLAVGHWTQVAADGDITMWRWSAIAPASAP